MVAAGNLSDDNVIAWGIWHGGAKIARNQNHSGVYHWSFTSLRMSLQVKSRKVLQLHT